MSSKTKTEPHPKAVVEDREEDFPKESKVPQWTINTRKGKPVEEE